MQRAEPLCCALCRSMRMRWRSRRCRACRAATPTSPQVRPRIEASSKVCGPAPAQGKRCCLVAVHACDGLPASWSERVAVCPPAVQAACRGYPWHASGSCVLTACIHVCPAADSTVHNPKMQDVELGKKGEA